MSDTRRLHSERPLSPHLQVYKPQMTSVLSILHRATGAALAIGTIMVTWWLLALAGGPQSYAVFEGFAGSPLGLFMLLGWSFSLFYHMTNGVRHLIWDTGHMFNISCATRAGFVVLAIAVLATAGAWFCAYNF